MNPVRAAVPPEVVIPISPVEPVPTTAVAMVEESTVNEAAADPPKVTALMSDRLLPLIVTVVPITADIGVNELITGKAI